MKLRGKVAIITGSTNGIGRAVAIRFSEEGAKVVVNGRNIKRGDEVVRLIKDSGQEAIFIKADVTNSNDIKKLIKKTVAHYGRLDILYNNVAIQLYKGVENTSEEEWDVTFATNVKSYFLCSKYAIPEMEKVGHGTIINTGSVLSFRGLGNETAYVSSKHAVLGLTKEMAIDLAPKNIRVVAICPGTTDAGLLEGYIKHHKDANIEDINKMQLPNRIGKPDEIARVAVFLATDNASWIIGTPVIVDGGSSTK